MRVLFMTPTLALGGSETLTIRYASGLQERGHEVVIAYGVRNIQTDALSRAQLTAVRLSERLPSLSSAWEWRRNLRRLISTFRPDIVHAQSVTSSTLVRSAAPTIPLLVTIHGIERKDEARATLALRLIRAGVTAVSDATAEGLGRFPWSPPVDVFSAGVSVARLRSRSAEEKAFEMVGAPRLCCVARLKPQKGVDVLLHALPSIAKAFPTVGLTLVGEGEELEEYQALAHELGLEDRTLFTGGVSNAAPYIAAADVVVLPSRWEGLPVVALESLALERPLVATAVAGTPLVVIDGETGWLVRPQDPSALADAVVDCLQTAPDELARRERNGRELVEERYSEQAMIDKLEDLLSSHSASRASSSPRMDSRSAGSS
jgi:glycosyltransferase involved in cell wall biosynthesis